MAKTRRGTVAAPSSASAVLPESGSRRHYQPSKQQRLRAQLIVAGLDLFRRNGFEATTVADIVEAVGISRRSFFRYFASKDDVVFDWLDEQGDFIRPRLAAQPPGEPPISAMREAFLQLAQYLDADRPRATLVTRIVFDTPTLSRRYQAENARWEVEIARILQRSRGAAELFALRLQISVATTTFLAALRAWAADNHGGELRNWVVTAFAVLESGLQALQRKPRAAAAKRK